jgi:hypothetical protein
MGLRHAGLDVFLAQHYSPCIHLTRWTDERASLTLVN